MLHRGEFYPFASEMNRLKELAKQVKTAEISDLFLTKGKKDLSPETTPELFIEGTAPELPGESLVDSKPTSVNLLDDLPDEIRKDFPEDLDLDLDEVLS